MVARRFGQLHNVGSPTPSAASVKIAVAVADEKGWLLRRLDVKQAFIQLYLAEGPVQRLGGGAGM